jgi:hypothetical protein
MPVANGTKWRNERSRKGNRKGRVCFDARCCGNQEAANLTPTFDAKFQGETNSVDSRRDRISIRELDGDPILIVNEDLPRGYRRLRKFAAISIQFRFRGFFAARDFCGRQGEASEGQKIERR